jgi:hypothetical protein
VDPAFAGPPFAGPAFADPAFAERELALALAAPVVGDAEPALARERFRVPVPEDRVADDGAGRSVCVRLGAEALGASGVGPLE